MAKSLNKGSQLFVSAAPQPTVLTQAAFEALEWELVCCPATLPMFGQEAEIVSEFCVSGEEVTFVGASSGSETEIEVYYDNECPGQDILREAFGGQPRAFKKEYGDNVGSATMTNTTVYARAFITTQPDSEGEINDISAHTFGLKMAQPPIFVKPESIVV